MSQDRRHLLILILLLIVLAALYAANLGGWLMHDDEGTDFYEAWQLQRGRQPGRDFLAEQQPLFLLAGSTILKLAGRSALHLRLLAVSQVLLGALALALAVRRLWGDLTAGLTLVLTLGSGLIYEQARLFRPDPMMLGWEMAGLGAALLAAKSNRRWLWSMSGCCYGVAMLWKPFGALPVVGIAFFFLHRLWRCRASWWGVIGSGLVFAAPFVLVVAGVSIGLYSQLGFYYLEPFEQHLHLGQSSTLGQQVGKTALAYVSLFLTNVVFLFVPALWRLNRAPEEHWSDQRNLLFCQLLAPVVFLAMTRPIYTRYFIFLIPALAVLMGWQVQVAVRKIDRQQPGFYRWAPVVAFLVAILMVGTTRPGLLRLLVRRESDTRRLATYVAERTAPRDKVLSDYAGINFFAARDSIYEASIIAGGRVAGRVVTGELLIERMDEDNVEMVLLHVAGGEPPPHQLINLIDFDEFQAYLHEHFELLTVFDRAGQQIEVYRQL